jgi:hypothetical protein
VTAQGNTVTDEKVIAPLSLSSSATSASVGAPLLFIDLDVCWPWAATFFRLAQARASSSKFGQAAALILHIYFILDQIGS